MKKLITCVLLFTLTACASSTDYGQCVGLNDKKDPKLEYKYSVRNLAVAIIFFGLVAPPLYVAFDELECPVGVK